MDVVENRSLLRMNTFGMDVSARYYADATSVEDIQELAGSKWLEGDLLLLGGGSNLLFTQDFDGLVVHMDLSGYSVTQEDDTHVFMRCAAGENWHKLVMNTVDQGWGGIENLSLIPGSVGAAPIQNIGAYGAELQDVFHELEAVHLATGQVRIFSKDECDFGYRHSIFKGKEWGNYAVTQVTLKLSKQPELNTSYGGVQEMLNEMGEEPSVWAISEAVCALRRSKLPDPEETGNAGSFFKNPVVTKDSFTELQAQHPNLPNYPAPNDQVKLAAGWLIEQAGWRGTTIGNVGSPQKHALTLVNYGGAQGQEVKDLAEQIQDSVEEKFGIRLEPEVRIL